METGKVTREEAIEQAAIVFASWLETAEAALEDGDQKGGE